MDSNKRTEICCSESGQHSVEFEPTCYSWCNVNIDVSNDRPILPALQAAADKFGYCLSHGENASTPTGMVCSDGNNITQPDDSATVTSTSSRGMHSTQVASSIGSGSASITSENLAVAAMETGSVKTTGLIGGLLLAAGVFGGGV